jgi:hypothetical protein
VSIRLTLENGSLWTLYTRRSDEGKQVKEGSKKLSLDDFAGENRLALHFKYVQARVSRYYVDRIQVSCSGEVFPGAGENESEKEGAGDEEKPATGTFQPGQVIINEVMADPKSLTQLPETEYVELHNTSGENVWLKNWVFVYGKIETALEGMQLPPHGYAVLYRAGKYIHVDDGGLAMPLSTFPSALADNGKDVLLKDPAGKLIDATIYPKARRGFSWERSEEGWTLSVDPRGGTPGSPNSVPNDTSTPGQPEEPDNPDEAEDTGQPEEPEEPKETEDTGQPDDSHTPEPPDEPVFTDIQPGDIVFNELLPYPNAGGEEYIELYNRSGRSLSVSGLVISVRKAEGALSTKYPLKKITATFEKDSYMLLTKNAEGVSAWYSVHSPGALHEIKLPQLANTSSTLVLYYAQDETVIDEVAYSSKWHDPSIKNQKGVSLERIHPDGKTQDADNWTSAASLYGHGTPGYKNSQSGNNPGETATGIETPHLIEDGMYNIPYRLDAPGYSCRAYVYNLAGSRVAEIANHELIGVNGALLWDGKGVNGSRLPAGIYILQVDLYRMRGGQSSHKKVFLVNP